MLSIGHSAKAILAESRTQRHSAKIGRRQICLCREPDTRQTLAVDKIFPLPSAGRSAKIGRRQKILCRVPGTRQNLAVGKGGRRDGGHLPSAFAECPAVRHLGTRQRIFYFYFFKFFAECPVTWHSAKASLPSAKVGTRQINFFLFFSPHFFSGALVQ